MFGWKYSSADKAVMCRDVELKEAFEFETSNPLKMEEFQLCAYINSSIVNDCFGFACKLFVACNDLITSLSA